MVALEKILNEAHETEEVAAGMMELEPQVGYLIALAYPKADTDLRRQIDPTPIGESKRRQFPVPVKEGILAAGIRPGKFRSSPVAQARGGGLARADAGRERLATPRQIAVFSGAR